MWRYWLRQSVQFAASLVGAVALACLLAALAHPVHSFWPFLSSYSHRITEAFTGNFGLSAAGRPALRMVAQELPATLQLVGAGAVIALLIGTPLGILLSASRTLRAAAPLMQIVAATPVFAGSLALIWFAARVLQWNEIAQPPSLATLVEDGSWAVAMRAFLLPALLVGAAGAACVQLYLRRAAAIAWAAPYRAGLRMMGLGAWDIDLRFAFPEIIAALLRNLGEIVLALVSAAAVVEWMFHRDGAAILFLQSVSAGDWNVAACVLFVFAAIKIVADFAGLISARLLAPEDSAS